MVSKNWGGPLKFALGIYEIAIYVDQIKSIIFCGENRRKFLFWLPHLQQHMWFPVNFQWKSSKFSNGICQLSLMPLHQMVLLMAWCWIWNKRLPELLTMLHDAIMQLAKINVVTSPNSHCWGRADYKFVPSQWEMALLCNDVSHWLGANLE